MASRAAPNLPESLWQAAVELARTARHVCGGAHIAVDYTRPKQPLNALPIPSRKLKPTTPAFVELIGSGATNLPECVIEFESGSDAKWASFLFVSVSAAQA